MVAPIAPEVRFFRFVDKQPDGCWLWTGSTCGTKSTYGHFRHTTNQNDPKIKAHIWSYQHHVGPVPDGMELDHLCRNPLCVRPDHLEPVPSSVNSERARLAVCRSGRHDLTDPANQRWDTRGRRRGCLPCWQERQRARVRI